MKAFRELGTAEPFGMARASLSQALAPVATANNIIVFDIPTLISRKNLLKCAILSPLSVAAYLWRSSRRSPAAQLAALQEIQESLDCTDMVIVFDAAHANRLMMLGTRRLVQIAVPALVAPPSAEPKADVLVINHGFDRLILDQVLAAAAALSPALSTAVMDPAAGGGGDPSGALPDATIHLHIGSHLDNPSAWRIVDSFAQNRLVVHLIDLDSPIGDIDIAHSQMKIDHNSSGLRGSDAREAIRGCQRLLSDPALGDLFRRNSSRYVGLFNGAIEQQMMGALQ